MPFIIYAIDKVGVEDLREKFRDKHREHLRSVGKKLLGSGALLDNSDGSIIGGVSLLNTESEIEAREFASQDPYSKAGIRASTEIIKWRQRWVNGEFVGEGSQNKSAEQE